MATTGEEDIKAQSGALGGQTTFERYGSEHFRQLAQKRKTFGGGRPVGSTKKKAKKRAVKRQRS